MKVKIILSSIVALFITNTSIAQSYEELLQIITNNNLEIKANERLQEADSYNYKTGLNPDDPQIEYGYYPGSIEEIGTKTTLDITQTLEFPTAYSYKRKISDNRNDIAGYQNKDLKQHLLLEASLNFIEIIYQNKINLELEKRMISARALLNAFEQKMEKGDAIILDVNKAKLRVMDLQRQQRYNDSQINKHLEILKELNNNQRVMVSDTIYPALDILDFETIRDEFSEKNPLLKSFEAEASYAMYQTRLNKSLWWPDLLVGYGSETILGESYRGVKVGLSVPLWQDRNKVRYATAFEEYTNYRQQSNKSKMISELFQIYIEANALNKNLEDYSKGLQDLNSIELLEKSLELGQITFVQYILEISYFYSIYDDWLLLEKEYFQTLARLYMYKL